VRSYITSQRGFHALPVILGVALLLAVGAGGWYVYQKRAGNPVSLTNPVASVPCDYTDKNVCKFLSSFKAQKNYRVVSSSGQGAEKFDFTIEMNGDDHSHTVMTQGGKTLSDVITIKDATYTKDVTDNKWWKEVAAKDKEEVKDSLTFKDDSNATDDKKADTTSKSEYKALGKEACGKLTCFKYQVITPGSEDAEYVWFDDKQYQLRKYMTVAKDDQTMTAEYSYDKITIKEPTPVKEGTPQPHGLNTLPASTGVDASSSGNAE
jgi:hypothetical protein